MGAARRKNITGAEAGTLTASGISIDDGKWDTDMPAGMIFWA